MTRHRKVCAVWATRDVEAVKRIRKEATNLERYGVVDAAHAPEVQARREATNQEKYGAANPFSREASTFQKVQASLEGKRPVLRGADNPFAWDDVKEKIRETFLDKHGVENPQQVPEIRERTRATNLERYGVEETLASPEIRKSIRATNEERYGGPAPSCSPEVLAKAQTTNMERFGVPWTNMDPEVRRKQIEAMEAKYGSHYFASDEGKAAVRATMKERYGVEFPAQVEGNWEKTVAVFRERYGVDHPLQLDFFNEKRFATCIERYGTPFPGRPEIGPNIFERRIGALCPQLVFTGDGKLWKRLPSLECYKNPDFILPGPVPGHPKRGVTKVIEAFGDYWHSRVFTGKANFEHEQELIDAYADIGISCLIIWESEVKEDIEAVGERVRAFVGNLPQPTPAS